MIRRGASAGLQRGWGVWLIAGCVVQCLCIDLQWKRVAAKWSRAVDRDFGSVSDVDVTEGVDGNSSWRASILVCRVPLELASPIRAEVNQTLTKGVCYDNVPRGCYGNGVRSILGGVQGSVGAVLAGKATEKLAARREHVDRAVPGVECDNVS